MAWTAFCCSHVLELASDSKVPVRAAAIEALDRAIVGTLGSPRHAVRRTGGEWGLSCREVCNCNEAGDCIELRPGDGAFKSQSNLVVVKPHTWLPYADETGSPRDDSGGVEYMLLVAMESLYSGNTERDVQSGVLRVLLNVLQVG